jgi:serine/threonine protein phosphatase PrpC
MSAEGSPISALRIIAYACSDKGRVRDGNEDRLLKGANVFAVADGMGGHQAGEVASELALEPLRALEGQTFAAPADAEEALRAAITAANDVVVEKAASDPKLYGMGTTLTAALVRAERLHIAHVGDSRAYLFTPGEGMSQLTTDHTLVEELVQEGRLSRDEVRTHPQRSVITRAIGVERVVDVDSLGELALRPGDQVLLCSDGLTGVVGDDEIARILAEVADGDAACAALLAAANDAGGPDNITVVLLRVDGDADGARHDGAGARLVPPASRRAAPRKPDIQIRTAPPSAATWDPQRMGRVGAPQGVDPRAVGPLPRRGRRIAVATAGVVALVALLGVGAWLLLSRAYFVGEDDGAVAIFHGLNSDVAGVPLFWVAERSDVFVDDLPQPLPDRLREGIPVGTVAEGRRLIADYRRSAGEDRSTAPGASPRPSPTPGTPPGTPPPTPAATPGATP